MEHSMDQFPVDRTMVSRIICDVPGIVEEKLNNFIRALENENSDILYLMQSQSTSPSGAVYVTITVLYAKLVQVES